jgi:hypothetical protein
LKSARKARTAKVAARRAEHKQLLAEQREQRDEAIAPAAQRKPVVSPDGDILRGARIVRDGAGFRVANSVRTMLERQRKVPDDGAVTGVLKIHIAVTDRLIRAWHIAGETVGMARPSFDHVRGAGSTGFIADAVIDAINVQMQAKAELAAARQFVGKSLWVPIDACVIRGVDVTAWAASSGDNRQRAAGYFVAALDRLVEFYLTAQKVRGRGDQMRYTPAAQATHTIARPV